MAEQAPERAGKYAEKFTPEETKQILEWAGREAVKPPRITTVVFDYGCVLSHVPAPDDFEPLRKAIGAEAATFQEMYWRNREAYDFDTLSVSAYFQEMGKAAGITFTPEQIQHLATLDSELWATPNSIMVEWVRALRDRGLKTAVLSNMSSNVSNYLRRDAKWLELFNQLCFSGDLKIGKPDPAIFRSCLDSLGVTAAEALFIDDREDNIKAAEGLGMHGIVFHSAQELATDLEPYGLAESLKEVIARVR